MLMRLAIDLPRELDMLTTFRHALDGELQSVGVAAQSRADAALILSEVCTNVLAHIHAGDHCRVAVTVDGPAFTVEVVGAHPAAPASNVFAESGHGLRIVRAIADTI